MSGSDLDMTRKGWGFTDPEHARPVWMTAEQRKALGVLVGARLNPIDNLLYGVCEAWDAAPADPAAAVLPLISPHTYMSWPADGRPKPGQDTARTVTDAVLHALGHPTKSDLGGTHE